jgi:hypothetical protein
MTFRENVRLDPFSRWSREICLVVVLEAGEGRGTGEEDQWRGGGGGRGRGGGGGCMDEEQWGGVSNW